MQRGHKWGLGATLVGLSSLTHGRSPRGMALLLVHREPPGKGQTVGQEASRGTVPTWTMLTGTCRITPVCPSQSSKYMQWAHAYRGTCMSTRGVPRGPVGAGTGPVWLQRGTLTLGGAVGGGAWIGAGQGAQVGGWGQPG